MHAVGTMMSYCVQYCQYILFYSTSTTGTEYRSIYCNYSKLYTVCAVTLTIISIVHTGHHSIRFSGSADHLQTGSLRSLLSACASVGLPSASGSADLWTTYSPEAGMAALPWGVYWGSWLPSRSWLPSGTGLKSLGDRGDAPGYR